eukprot:15082156-Heterocapsa_arctica.AAC.1
MSTGDKSALKLLSIPHLTSVTSVTVGIGRFVTEQVLKTQRLRAGFFSQPSALLVLRQGQGEEG